ncbi:MAG: methyltransferase domain-containing protein [Clostridia bacterium]|nr:methyltransferase domain-containing protein [Clostridia bacterium]
MENRNNTVRTAAARGAFAADKIVDRAVYNALYAVFYDGAYCQKALTDSLRTLKDDRSYAFVTSAFYGVLDNNIRLTKLIDGLCEKTPGVAPSTVLKIGLYYLGYADMPDYAAVNRAVELSKQLNGVYSGFINAVLKKSVGFKPKFANSLEKFSYDHNVPMWLAKMLILDYSETRAAAMLDAPLPDKTHVRPVTGRLTEAAFAATAKRLGCRLTDCGCYCDRTALAKFKDGTITAQSRSSMLAVRAYKKGIDGGKALDLCAAPGGKSLYLSELGDFDITACDIYEHKIKLMQGLANKLGANIKVKLNDATLHNSEFDDAFDLVIADCPCSGTGTLRSKPDILLRRKPSDLEELCALQVKIMNSASKYCRVGGVLCYSTCSVLKCENEKIRAKFLEAHTEYEPIDETKLTPDKDLCDGFYIARFKRKA